MKALRILLALVAIAAICVFATECQHEERTIRIEAPHGAEVLIGIYAVDGTLVRELEAPIPDKVSDKRFVVWDGFDDNDKPVPLGNYNWTAVTTGRFGLKLSGTACLNEPPDRLPGGIEPQPWGGRIGGTPTAVAADDTRVYLGWSGGQVVACDLDGHIVWSVSLPDIASCRALAVDGETVVALAAQRPPFLSGDHLVKLRATDGAVQSWPSGPSLPVTSLWPANAAAKPAYASAMSARTGRVYLSFSELQFLAVLRTDTGEYLQTVVGPPPGAIDVTPTKTESPDEPGKLVDVDFAIVALQGGTLGKVLFAHDPLWVMTSDFQPLDRDENITALALLGDGAKHHKHSIFVGLGPPFHQVQRRSVLNSEGFLWIAGRAGGRAATGPWDADALGSVNAVALDARGRLWIAEGDAVPPRFSVWNTEGNQGRLEREFFGPVSGLGQLAAVLPDDPEVIVGAGCEWRIDPLGGPARCLGVITRDETLGAGFRRSDTGTLLLHLMHPDRTVSVFERRGEGDYVPREQHATGEDLSFGPTSRITLRDSGPTVDLEEFSGVWLVSTADHLRLGVAREPRGKLMGGYPANTNGVSSIARGADGKVYAAVANGGLFRVEITGLDAIRRLSSGKLQVRAVAPRQVPP